ncbi:MAG: Hint domain-containing protein [Roseovarius sp.]
MAWIGLFDGQNHVFDPSGLEPGTTTTQRLPSPDLLMPRGSLMIETRLSPDGKPRKMIEVRRSHPWAFGLSLQALPGGGFILIESQNDRMRHVTLPYVPDGRMDVIRLTYRWDAPGKWGSFTMERPETDSSHTVDIQPPHPLPMADLAQTIIHPHHRDPAADISVLALSDSIEPHGPLPGLTGNVPVATPYGYKPAGFLKRGDLVLTEDGRTVPVLQSVRQTMPALGSLRPVRLRAPYYGLRRDVILAPHQRLVISGTQVEYLFGHEAVLVPARHLINGVSALPAKGPNLVTYHHLLLPNHETIMAAGCPVESLFVGRLRRKPGPLAASILAAFDRAQLPEHAKPVWPVLKPFEAIALAQSRAA